MKKKKRNENGNRPFLVYITKIERKETKKNNNNDIELNQEKKYN